MYNLPPELLAAILADPDADLPRLVAADWLDEHDDADTAEFIRLQCDTDPGQSDQPNAERESELLRLHASRWLIPIEPLLENRQHHWVFRRGFLERLTVESVRTDAEVVLLAAMPTLEHIWINQSTLIRTLTGDCLTALARVVNLRTLWVNGLSSRPIQSQLEPLVSLRFLRNFQLPPYAVNRAFDELQQVRLGQFRELPEQERLIALRIRLGGSGIATRNGLRIFGDNLPRLERQAVYLLPGLRSMTLNTPSNDELAVIPADQQIHSLNMGQPPHSQFRLSQSLRNLRELRLYGSEHFHPTEDFVHTLDRFDRLESLEIRTYIADADELGIALNRRRTLRTITLGRRDSASLILNRIRIRGLIELSVSDLSWLPSIEFLNRLPRLRFLQFPRCERFTTLPEAAALIAQRGILCSSGGPPDPDWRERVTTWLSEPRSRKRLLDGTTLNLPAWMRRQFRPIIRSGEDLPERINLGEWIEFGTNRERPDLLRFGPMTLRIERIPRPPGEVNVRELLTEPPTMFEMVRWSSVKPIPGGRGSMIASHSHGFGEFRAVWIGKCYIHRMIAEYSRHRLIRWREVLPMIAATLVPGGFDDVQSAA